MIRSWLKKLRRFFAPNSQYGQADSNSKNGWNSSPENHSFTVADLNPDAARRQAKIGRDYARDRTTKKRLGELKSGIVTLPPHEPWSGNYTDWTADPFQDLNWRFQFHTLRWINPLLWDALDGNKESKAEWKRIVRSWAMSNCPPQQAEDKYAWMDMTDGNRAIQTSLGAPLMDDEDQWYVDLLVAHRNWLLDDSKIVPGNHGLHQNLGLFVVSVVLNDKSGIERSIDRLAAQVLDAFDDHGLNEEGSVAYHQINVVWWRQARKRLKLEGYDFSEEAVDRLEKAGEAMAYLLLPDGTMPQIGDGGRGKGRRGLHPLLDEVLEGEVVGKSKPPLFKHFPNGFTVSRSGWGETRPFVDESHTIIRHGIDLERHSHNDRGSVHIYTHGHRWITDGGFHSYQRRNKNRNYTKSRAAHSLVDLPGQKYDETGDVPAQLVEDQSGLHAIEVLDANFESAQWRRRVIFLTDLDVWIIWDRIDNPEVHTIHQQWLIDIGIHVKKLNPRSLTLGSKQSQLFMNWHGDAPELDIARGNRSSGLQRGLIGIGWKRMRNGTSVHAKFNSEQTDSIVVISPHSDDELQIDLAKRASMVSFEMVVNHHDRFFRVKADSGATRYTEST